MKKIFETDYLFLREMTDDDFESLKRILKSNDESVTDEYVKKWIDWCKSSYEKNGFGQWAVVLQETGEMIASCGVSMQYIDDEWKPELGYHLRKDLQRKGIGTSMSLAAMRYFFKTYNYDELYSYMEETNIASIKLAESIEMTYLHKFVTKDGKTCRVYRIERDDWEMMVFTKIYLMNRHIL